MPNSIGEDFLTHPVHWVAFVNVLSFLVTLFVSPFVSKKLRFILWLSLTNLCLGEISLFWSPLILIFLRFWLWFWRRAFYLINQLSKLNRRRMFDMSLYDLLLLRGMRVRLWVLDGFGLIVESIRPLWCLDVSNTFAYYLDQCLVIISIFYDF